jgi:ATP-binding cassette, subfamily B, bacterial
VKAAAKTRIDPKDLPSVEAATLRRIAGYVRPHSFRICIVATSIFMAAILNLVPSWAVKRVIDDAIPHRDLKLLLLWCAAMTVGPLAAGLLQVVQKHTAETIGQDVMLELRVALYEHLQAMPFAFFQTQRPGEAVSHVLNDVQGAGSVVGGTLLGVAQNAISLALTLAFVVALDWRLALVASAFLPLFIIPTRRVGRMRKAIKRDVQSRMAEITGMLTETLSVSGALLVKIFGREKAEVQRFQEKARDLRRLSLEQSLAGRWFQMLLGLFESVGPALVFAAGGLLVINGHIPLGTIVAFVTLLKRIYGPASDLAGVHVDLRTSYAYFDRLFEVLDRPGSVRDAPDAIILERPHGHIEFKDVSFAYGDAGWALREVNLRVPPGSTVAIVGPSGAGKSTIGSLVARLYDPTEGTLSIDGIDLRQMAATSLRAAVAVVSQETFLFHGSVLDNLRYGKPRAWRSDVVRVAKLAQIHDVISALPEGYDTVVGARGHRFSGGERQRLAIARAILTDPSIIVFDEATSALDNASERRVQDALAYALKAKTTLIIAHRLSTVRHADLIVVLDAGRIVEVGTHGELLARTGLYAWLWNIQVRESAYEQLRHLGPDAWSPPVVQYGARVGA